MYPENLLFESFVIVFIITAVLAFAYYMYHIIVLHKRMMESVHIMEDAIKTMKSEFPEYIVTIGTVESKVRKIRAEVETIPLNKINDRMKLLDELDGLADFLKELAGSNTK